MRNSVVPAGKPAGETTGTSEEGRGRTGEKAIKKGHIPEKRFRGGKRNLIGEVGGYRHHAKFGLSREKGNAGKIQSGFTWVSTSK